MSKIKIDVVKDVELLGWFNKQLSRKKFGNRSYTLEFALTKLEKTDFPEKKKL